LAEVLSASTGYPLAEQGKSCGGYKDWCIQSMKIPSFTIEVGKDTFSHPLGEEALLDILSKNKNVLYDLSKEYGI
jgi:g-D-glutamyl-meso-diaminopimelate peptidase